MSESSATEANPAPQPAAEPSAEATERPQPSTDDSPAQESPAPLSIKGAAPVVPSDTSASTSTPETPFEAPAKVDHASGATSTLASRVSEPKKVRPRVLINAALSGVKGQAPPKELGKASRAADKARVLARNAAAAGAAPSNSSTSSGKPVLRDSSSPETTRQSGSSSHRPPLPPHASSSTSSTSALTSSAGSKAFIPQPVRRKFASDETAENEAAYNILLAESSSISTGAVSGAAGGDPLEKETSGGASKEQKQDEQNGTDRKSKGTAEQPLSAEHTREWDLNKGSSASQARSSEARDPYYYSQGGRAPPRRPVASPDHYAPRRQYDSRHNYGPSYNDGAQSQPRGQYPRALSPPRFGSRRDDDRWAAGPRGGGRDDRWRLDTRDNRSHPPHYGNGRPDDGPSRDDRGHARRNSHGANDSGRPSYGDGRGQDFDSRRPRSRSRTPEERSAKRPRRSSQSGSGPNGQSRRDRSRSRDSRSRSPHPRKMDASHDRRSDSPESRKRRSVDTDTPGKSSIPTVSLPARPAVTVLGGSVSMSKAEEAAASLAYEEAGTPPPRDPPPSPPPSLPTGRADLDERPSRRNERDHPVRDPTPPLPLPPSAKQQPERRPISIPLKPPTAPRSHALANRGRLPYLSAPGPSSAMPIDALPSLPPGPPPPPPPPLESPLHITPTLNGLVTHSLPPDPPQRPQPPPPPLVGDEDQMSGERPSTPHAPEHPPVLSRRPSISRSQIATPANGRSPRAKSRAGDDGWDDVEVIVEEVPEPRRRARLPVYSSFEPDPWFLTAEEITARRLAGEAEEAMPFVDDAEITEGPLERVYVGSSHISDYTLQEKLGEGTFGVVWKGVKGQIAGVSDAEVKKIEEQEEQLVKQGLKVRRGQAVALKQIILHNEGDGMPITSLREIRILKSLEHPNVVPVVDIASEPGDSTTFALGKTYMVFPYMDHDLAGLLENASVRLLPEHIKQYARQLLQGTHYLHENGILHRDMKAANLLISNSGVLMIADFGLARSVERAEKRRQYTNCVVTRWYRPPELLLGEERYHLPVDMWGVGCVIAEMFAKKPIFPGDSDLNQAHVIFSTCGSPNDSCWPDWRETPDAKSTNWGDKARTLRADALRWSSDDAGFADLVDKILVLDPKQRLTASEALNHEWFWTEPYPTDPSQMPRYKSSHEYDKRKQEEERPARHYPPVPVFPPPQQISYAQQAYQQPPAFGAAPPGPAGYAPASGFPPPVAGPPYGYPAPLHHGQHPPFNAQQPPQQNFAGHHHQPQHRGGYGGSGRPPARGQFQQNRSGYELSAPGWMHKTAQSGTGSQQKVNLASMMTGPKPGAGK